MATPIAAAVGGASRRHPNALLIAILRALAPAIVVAGAGGALAGSECADARAWAGQALLNEAAAPSGPADGPAPRTPFSFTYGGRASAELLAASACAVKKIDGDADRERYAMTRTLPTGLELVCEATLYTKYPAIDYVLRFRNTGSADSALLSEIEPLDTQLRLEAGAAVFHYSRGSSMGTDDFLPLDAALGAGTHIALPAAGERSQAWLPYFNAQWAGGGMVGAIGWTGQWSLAVDSDDGAHARIRAGQQTTHLVLHPGESIRTPRILLVLWQGAERMRGHNLLRRLLLEHYVPRVKGQVASAPVSQNTFYTHAGNGVNEQNQLATIAGMRELGVEAYWLDAGWFTGGWPNGVGNWQPNPQAFPNGLRPLGDAAHRAGMKFILWFEPERVATGSRIARLHPDWVLSKRAGDKEAMEGEGGLFDLGLPAARQWMTAELSNAIGAWGVDTYRQDRNLYPFRLWQAADRPDRQGIAEIRHVEGLYAMWDDLLRQHPGLTIDNANWRCTGPDLEMVMRSSGSFTCSETKDARVPLYNQVQSCGLSLYLPLHANLVWGFDAYAFRSTATTGASLSMEAGGIDAKRAADCIAETKRLRPLFLGDFYPLTAITLDEGAWCAWQYDRADLGEGFALAFRRAECTTSGLVLALSGIDPTARYRVRLSREPGVEDERMLSGAQLASLPIEIAHAPGSLLVIYQKRGAGPARREP